MLSMSQDLPQINSVSFSDPYSSNVSPMAREKMAKSISTADLESPDQKGYDADNSYAQGSFVSMTDMEAKKSKKHIRAKRKQTNQQSCCSQEQCIVF
jgi:hypothetical protein